MKIGTIHVTRTGYDYDIYGTDIRNDLFVLKPINFMRTVSGTTIQELILIDFKDLERNKKDGYITLKVEKIPSILHSIK